MRQPRAASPSEVHHADERKLHLAENLWKALVFVFAEIKAVARFIWRSPHHFDAFIHWLDTLDPSRALASWGFAPADVTLGRERRFQGLVSRYQLMKHRPRHGMMCVATAGTPPPRKGLVCYISKFYKQEGGRGRTWATPFRRKTCL